MIMEYYLCIDGDTAVREALSLTMTADLRSGLFRLSSVVAFIWIHRHKIRSPNTVLITSLSHQNSQQHLCNTVFVTVT